MNNVRSVQINNDNSMNLEHLQVVLEKCLASNQPVGMICCTMGTTDAFAIDPIADVRKLIDKFKNPKGCPKPLLYADAVIGWSWLAFRSYDFEKNPLQFSKKAIKVLKHNYEQIAPLHNADAIGIDFHKDKGTVMREMSKHFPKNMMKKVGFILKESKKV